MSDPRLVQLSPESIQAVACRVVELLREATGAPEPPSAVGGLLTAAEVAHRFGVRRSWVYEHAAALGVMRLGEGPRPRLRFDTRTVADRLAARSTGEGSREPEAPDVERKRPGRPRRRTGASVELLPIRGPDEVRSTVQSKVAPRRANARGRGDGGSSSAASRTLPLAGDVRTQAQPDLRQNEGG
jgi:hypothetical protein